MGTSVAVNRIRSGQRALHPTDMPLGIIRGRLERRYKNVSKEKAGSRAQEQGFQPAKEVKLAYRKYA